MPVYRQAVLLIGTGGEISSKIKTIVKELIQGKATDLVIEYDFVEHRLVFDAWLPLEPKSVRDSHGPSNIPEHW